MLIDHIGLYYEDKIPVPAYTLLRVVGSLSLPLYAYLFAANMLRTRNAWLYFLRILACAMVTQAILIMVLPFVGLSVCDFPLNSLYTLLCAFGVIYGCELLFAVPADRIGSLHLIKANAATQSDRYDVRIGSGLSSHAPRRGIYIPPLAPSALFWLAILIIAPSVLLSFLIRMEYGVFGVLTALLFYLVEKYPIKNKVTWAFFLFLALDMLYILFHYATTGMLSVHGAGIAAIFLCYLPMREKKQPAFVRNAYYVFFPLHILLLLLLRLLF